MIRSATGDSAADWRPVPAGFRIQWGEPNEQIMGLATKNAGLLHDLRSGLSCAYNLAFLTIAAIGWRISDIFRRPSLPPHRARRLPAPSDAAGPSFAIVFHVAISSNRRAAKASR